MGILGWCGYISTAEEVFVEQPAGAILAIKLLLVIMPLIVFVAGMIVCAKFKIGREDAKREGTAQKEG